jgi:drug/metabolite transporter (DMT)-like permease
MKKINYPMLGIFAFVILSWGLGWPITKIGLEYMSASWYAAIRLIMATIMMMAAIIALKKFSWPHRRDLPLIFIIGILQIGGYMLLANIGLTYIPAGRAALIGYTTPLWVMPATIWLFKEPVRWQHCLGFMLGLGGLIILLSPWELNWSNNNIILGAIMLLLASFAWAISMLCTRYMHWNKSPLELIPWQLLVGAIPALIIAWTQDAATSIQWTPALIWSLLYTGILVTGLSYWTGVMVTKELPTLVVSLGLLLVPVCSLTISTLYMHESLNALTLTAFGLIISGIVCVIL